MRFCYVHYLQLGQATGRPAPERPRARAAPPSLRQHFIPPSTSQPSPLHQALQSVTAPAPTAHIKQAARRLWRGGRTPLIPRHYSAHDDIAPSQYPTTNIAPTAHPAVNQKRTQPISHAPLSLFHKYLKPRRSPRRPHRINDNATVLTQHGSTDRGARICGSRRHGPTLARPKSNRQPA